MENIKKPEKPWYKKTWVIVIGILILLSVIGNLGKKDAPKNSTLIQETSNTSNEESEKQWKEVYTFKGNGMKKSPSFELNGGKARLKYKYKAPDGLGMGVFFIYVVNDGEDVMKTGGIAEVMSQAENEESESSLQKSAGLYYLYINASGDWTVTVEEMK